MLSKRLFIIGSGYADRDDPVAAGLAISIFQDSIEIFIWTLLKKLDAQVKENAAFTSYFEHVKNAPGNTGLAALPLKAKILELNKARINFKHYGNLPDCSEAKKFRAYAEEFLILSYQLFFDVGFEDVSLVDLVHYPDVRARLKCAEALINEEKYEPAIAEVAIAKSMLFTKMAQYFPRVDRNLSDADRIIDPFIGNHGFRYFSYISEYLKSSREANIITMLGVSMQDYVFL